MSNEQARILLCALVHDGINPEKLSDKARQEIRKAFELILKMVAATSPVSATPQGTQKV